jgi:ribonuclease III
MQNRARLETAIGYSFQNRPMLERALTHRSHAKDRATEEHNERLEFLGDAVLQLAVSEILMESYPGYTEGRLTKIRAQLVSAENLYKEARALHLGESLNLGLAEEKSGREKKALLADALEAIIAAVYLDGGFAAARALIQRLIASPLRVSQADQTLAHLNPKSTLQELLQARKLPPPQYKIVAEHGPPHGRVFEVSLIVGEICRTTGCGVSKREAEQAAAARALDDKELRAVHDIEPSS